MSRERAPYTVAHGGCGLILSDAVCHEPAGHYTGDERGTPHKMRSPNGDSRWIAYVEDGDTLHEVDRGGGWDDEPRTARGGIRYGEQPPPEIAAWHEEADRLILHGDGTEPVPEIAALSRQFSQWLNSTYPADLSEEAHLWRRVTKVCEESGEVRDALGAFLHENPRKPPGPMDDVIKELSDCVGAALGAIEDLTGHKGQSLAIATAVIRANNERVGLTAPEPEYRFHVDKPVYDTFTRGPV